MADQKPVKLSAAKVARRPVKAATKPAIVKKAAKPELAAPKPVVAAKASPKLVTAKVVPVAKAAAVAVAPAVKLAPVPEAAKPVVVAMPKPIEVAAKVTEIVKETVATVVKPVVAAVETVKPVAAPVAQSIQKGFVAMAEKITAQSFVPTPENMQAMFGDFSARTKGAVEKSTKIVEEMGEFAKGNVEAMMASGKLAAKGAETLGQEAADYSKKSFETATTAFKSFVAAKSPTELFKLQSDYARSSFDAAVAESSKFSEAMLKLFGEIAQPISSRVAVAAEKIKTPAF
jgi:phasin family protein